MMKVVLTKTIDNVGVVGETKEVKPGYARNYLFPKRLAVLVDDSRAKEYQAQRAAATEAYEKQRKLVSELAEQWRGQTYTVTARASEDGTLYGSVGAKELRKLLGRDDLELEMPTLKTVGTHQIELQLAGAKVPVTVIVEAESRLADHSKKTA